MPINDEVFRRAYAPYLPSSVEAPILDLGCGTGLLLENLHEAGHKGLYGVDIDDGALVEARRRASTAQLDLIAAQGLPAWLSAHPGFFAAVISRQSLYYFPPESLNAWLGAIRAALRPGGVLIVEVFNQAATTSWLIRAKDRAIVSSFHDLSLKAHVERAGFQVEALFGDPFRSRTLRTFVFSLAQRVWQQMLRLIFFIERGLDPANPTIFSKNIFLVARNQGPFQKTGQSEP